MVYVYYVCSLHLLAFDEAPYPQLLALTLSTRIGNLGLHHNNSRGKEARGSREGSIREYKKDTREQRENMKEH